MSRVYIIGEEIKTEELLDSLHTVMNNTELEFRNIKSNALSPDPAVLIVVFELAKSIGFSTCYDLIKYTVIYILSQTHQQTKKDRSNVKYIKIVNGEKSSLIETDIELSKSQKEQLIDAAIKSILNYQEDENA